VTEENGAPTQHLPYLSKNWIGEVAGACCEARNAK